jgi:hypothetical protein
MEATVTMTARTTNFVQFPLQSIFSPPGGFLRELATSSQIVCFTAVYSRKCLCAPGT